MTESVESRLNSRGTSFQDSIEWWKNVEKSDEENPGVPTWSASRVTGMFTHSSGTKDDGEFKMPGSIGLGKARL